MLQRIVVALWRATLWGLISRNGIVRFVCGKNERGVPLHICRQHNRIDRFVCRKSHIFCLAREFRPAGVGVCDQRPKHEQLGQARDPRSAGTLAFNFGRRAAPAMFPRIAVAFRRTALPWLPSAIRFRIR
jgi:hypothetical protein